VAAVASQCDRVGADPRPGARRRRSRRDGHERADRTLPDDSPVEGTDPGVSVEGTTSRWRMRWWPSVCSRLAATARFDLREEAVRTSVEDVTWPARLELRHERGLDVLIDGAHNRALPRCLTTSSRLMVIGCHWSWG
jgi:hypothetical protein